MGISHSFPAQAKLTARTMVRALRTVPALKDLSDDGLAAVSEVFKTRVKRRGLCVDSNHWFGGSPPNFRTL